MKNNLIKYKKILNEKIWQTKNKTYNWTKKQQVKNGNQDKQKFIKQIFKKEKDVW